MGVFIYILCFLVAVLSFVCIYAMIKEKQKWFWLILPVYMDLVILLVLYTQEIAYFGLLGVLGLIPLFLFLRNAKNTQ